MKTKGSIFIGLSALLFSFVLSTAVFCLSANRRELSNQEQLTRVIAADTYDSIASELLPTVAVSNSMSHNTFLIRMLQEESLSPKEQVTADMAEYLTGIRDSVGAFTSFVISDKSRRYYSYEGLHKIISPEEDEHDIWYSIFVDGRKSYDLDVDTDQVNGDSWTVFVNSRIEDSSGKLLGVCGIGTKIDNIQETLRHYEEEYKVKINLVNKDGIVQVDTSSINLDSPYLYNIQYGEVTDFISSTGPDGACTVTRYLDHLGWYLAVRNEGSGAKLYPEIIIKGLICYLAAAILYLTLWFIFASKKKTAL